MPLDRAVRALVISTGVAAALAAVFILGLREPASRAFAAVKTGPADRVLAVACLDAPGCTTGAGRRVILLEAAGQDPATACLAAEPGSISAPDRSVPGLVACVVEG